MCYNPVFIGNFSPQIVFEGVVGAGIRGDIAIDDILMSNGSCNPGMYTLCSV